MTEPSPAVADVLRRLTIVFTEFEQALEATPIIRRLGSGRFTLVDYHAFLVGLRQQVRDGAQWMARAASSIDETHFDLRSTVLRHAVTEHRDYRLLEQDFVAAGGELAVIQSAEPNVGTEALTAWMFHEAGKPNPFGLLGAMWIIEGLGSIKASEWGGLVRKRLDLPPEAVRFLLYHGDNDAGHIQEFREMLEMVLPDEAVAARIVKTARVTARLYTLQIAEMLS